MSAPSGNPFIADKPKNDGATTLIILAALFAAALPVGITLIILLVAS